MIKHKGRVMHSSDLCDPLLVKEIILSAPIEERKNLQKEIVSVLWQAGRGYNPVPSLKILVENRRFHLSFDESDRKDLMAYPSGNDKIFRYIVCDKKAPFNLCLGEPHVAAAASKSFGLFELSKMEHDAVLGGLTGAAIKDALLTHLAEKISIRCSNDKNERMTAFRDYFARLAANEDFHHMAENVSCNVLLQDDCSVFALLEPLMPEAFWVDRASTLKTLPQKCLDFLWTSNKRNTYAALFAEHSNGSESWRKQIKHHPFFGPEVERLFLLNNIRSNDKTAKPARKI